MQGRLLLHAVTVIPSLDEALDEDKLTTYPGFPT